MKLPEQTKDTPVQLVAVAVQKDSEQILVPEWIQVLILLLM